MGAPEEIEEKYLDPKTKQEVFLKKVVNHFDPYGKIVSQDFYDGKQKHLYSLHKTYNDQGLLVLETDPLGNQTKYSYDANHNLAAIESKDVLFEYHYDLKNRPIETIQSASFTSLKTYTTYDPNGNILSTADPRGNFTEYVYDELGRVSSVTFPQTAVEENSLMAPKATYTYDIFDSPTSITDSYGNNTIISYTPRKTPVEIIHPDGSLELFKYDPEGSLHRYCGQDGIIQVFEYDYLGRISHIEYYERGATGKRDGFKRKYYTYNAFSLTSEKDEGGYKTSYLYDGAGRLKSFTKDTQKVEYFYNPQGRAREIKTWKSPNDFTLHVKEYDLQGNVILITPQRDSLFAEQMYYDQKRQWLFSNQPVRLKSVTANNGQGDIFDSDTKFKNYTILTRSSI